MSVCYVMFFWIGASSDGSVIALAIVLGWLTLVSQFVLPLSLSYLTAREQKGLKLLDDNRQLPDLPLLPACHLKKENVPDSEAGASKRHKSKHVFLSHKWSTGQDQVHSMYDTLSHMCPTLKMWLDIEDGKEETGNYEARSPLQKSPTASNLPLSPSESNCRSAVELSVGAAVRSNRC